MTVDVFVVVASERSNVQRAGIDDKHRVTLTVVASRHFG